MGNRLQINTVISLGPVWGGRSDVGAYWNNISLVSLPESIRSLSGHELGQTLHRFEWEKKNTFQEENKEGLVMQAFSGELDLYGGPQKVNHYLLEWKSKPTEHHDPCGILTNTRVHIGLKSFSENCPSLEL